MSNFNLSDWALKHQSLVLFFMIVLTVIGLASYTKLGQSEDPPFTFKAMVIRTGWPGADANEVALQVTDKLEKKLQEVPHLDFVSSYSRAGESVIVLRIKDSTAAKDMPDAWYQARKKINDIRNTLPANIEGPSFNDEFGDVYGNMYALTGKGYSYAELKRQADVIRSELLRIPDVAKVDFFGEQKQRLFIELSNAKNATLGIDSATLISAIQAQNPVVASGAFNTDAENIRVAVSGRFNSVEDLQNMHFRAADRDIRLGDVAKIYRGYQDPASQTVRYMGQQAMFIGVSMATGGDIVALGSKLDATIAKASSQLPVGLELHTVTSQPEAVQRSVHEFVRSLAEAVIIVLAVSLLSLGLRTGLVVAITIPIVLAITFLFMHIFNVGLHKISLGALILALGLLVDDAIIAVEMMASKMEQGWDRAKAASHAFTSTAMPMLTGTLVTAAGFLPIATAQSSTGEYTRSIFQVTVIALLVSWCAAVIFVPYLGYKLLPDYAKHAGKPSLLARLMGKTKNTESAPATHTDIYDSRLYRKLRSAITSCVRHYWIVIFVTIAVFIVAIIGFGKVQQQFFPDSTRPELIVDLRLTEGASFEATDAAVKKLEAWLSKQNGIENYVAYIGSGSPRFYLPLDQQLPRKNFAEFVVLAKDLKSREEVRGKLIKLFEQDFPNLRGSVFRLENGPPVGFPVQFRVSGPGFDESNFAALREQANKVAAVMRDNPYLSNVQTDWEEPIKSIHINVDQSKARILGITSAEIANFLSSALNELYITEYREGNERIDLVVRGNPLERRQVSRIPDLMIKTASKQSVPLAQVANIEYTFEEGLIWRRSRIPTITVRGTLYGHMQAPVVSNMVEEKLKTVREQLPVGYHIDTGGAVEESGKGGASVAAGAPLFIVAVLTILMIQLQSFSRVTLVLLTAPLGIIGVALFLLIFDKPFGFVAMLGTIALSGMIMRNSVILVDQVAQDKAAGKDDWEAIVESTVRRFRPIVLTAAAAILAMIPLTRSAFFAPMAVAIMGGLTVATLLTVISLPALYAAWYRVKVPDAV
ncbi:MAG TPA: efflux RND transporter permease subunit [Methylophilaceae bacterium]|nr:efflux RND transporter permease subunit [Methylophilaceae bacterium]